VNHASAEATLGKRSRRKLANNTYLERRSEGQIAVKLHATDILIFHPDGSTEYQSGGWRTPTTKNRMNEFGPGPRIWSDRGIWQVWNGGEEPIAVYADGMVYRDGVIEGGGDAKDERGQRRRVKAYAKAYMDALERGEVPAPGAGDCCDCWYCALGVERDATTGKIHHGYSTADLGSPTLGEQTATLMPDGRIENRRNTDHILSHMSKDERYFVPSLLQRAMEIAGASQSMWWWLGSFWDTSASEEQKQGCRRFSERDRVEKALRKYILWQLGLSR
jgi:hypothetical protein